VRIDLIFLYYVIAGIAKGLTSLNLEFQGCFAQFLNNILAPVVQRTDNFIHRTESTIDRIDKMHFN